MVAALARPRAPRRMAEACFKSNILKLEGGGVGAEGNLVNKRIRRAFLTRAIPNVYSRHIQYAAKDLRAAAATSVQYRMIIESSS